MKIFRTLFEEMNTDGADSGTNIEIDNTQDTKAQEIIDRIKAEENGEDYESETNDVELPSDKQTNEEDDEGGDDTGGNLYANKYATIDDLKKGIKNVGGDLPDYILNGMSDTALVQYYEEKRKEFSSSSKDEKTDRKYSENKEDNKSDDADEKGEDDKSEKIDVNILYSDLESKLRVSHVITDEMYDEFEKAGVPSNIVDKFADTIVAEQATFTKNVYEIAGGEEEFAKVKAWAEDGNIPASQLKAMETMPYDQILLAMRGIKATYDAKVGTQNKPQRIEGKQTNNNIGNGYKSQDEYLADIKDKRYNTDARFRSAVEKKLQRSKF